MPRMRKLALGVAIVLAGALLMLGAACGGGGGGGRDKADVEATIQALADAWNGKDVDAFVAAVTDKFLSDEFEFASREEAAQAFPEFIGDPPITLGEFSNTQVSADTATTEANFFFAKGGTPNEFSLVREEDVWKLDGTQPIAGEIPDAVTAVDLKTLEYKFDFDEAAITSGNIAFNISNIGGEEHEVGLARIPADADIEQLLRSEEDEPPGVEFIGHVDPLAPGAGTTFLFTEPLEPGRYVMFCFVEAADGEPHALKGMWAEFTIE